MLIYVYQSLFYLYFFASYLPCLHSPDAQSNPAMSISISCRATLAIIDLRRLRGRLPAVYTFEYAALYTSGCQVFARFEQKDVNRSLHSRKFCHTAHLTS